MIGITNLSKGDQLEILILIWVVCAALCYFIAKDRAPSKAGIATLLGFLFGPLGILFTFFLKP